MPTRGVSLCDRPAQSDIGDAVNRKEAVMDVPKTLTLFAVIALLWAFIHPPSRRRLIDIYHHVIHDS